MLKKTLSLFTIAALCLNYAVTEGAKEAPKKGHDHKHDHKHGHDHQHKPAIKGAEPGKWTQDYDAALKVAAEKNLPLMLNFTGSDWCGWCKIMDKNVFADQKVWGAYAKDNLMLVTLDFPKDKTIVPEKWVARNKELQAKFGVRGYPSYVVLDNDGKTKLGQLGASREATPKSFIQQTKAALRFSKNAIDAFTKSLSEEKAGAYKALLAAHKQAKKDLTDWIATRPQRNEENNAKFKKFQENIASSMAKIESFK